MPCYFPLKPYKAVGGGVTFDKSKSVAGITTKIPCGQCVGCRIDYSRQWAIRCVHEASLYKKNCFITLTYNEQNLPKNGSLDKKHFQKFMKRLRKKFAGKIRYYHCGEYGEQLQRPHYHACLFNHDFPDKKFWKKQNGVPYFTSEILEKLWPFGYSTIGEVTFESAAYCARYIMKKINGERQQEHYEKINTQTGEIINLQPEYTTMSRKPGLAKDWYDKYKSDVFPDDFVVLKGKKLKTPKYYTTQYQIEEPEKCEALKKQRIANLEKHKIDNTIERLDARHKCQLAKLKQLIRHKDI